MSSLTTRQRDIVESIQGSQKDEILSGILISVDVTGTDLMEIHLNVDLSQEDVINFVNSTLDSVLTLYHLFEVELPNVSDIKDFYTEMSGSIIYADLVLCIAMLKRHFSGIITDFFLDEAGEDLGDDAFDVGQLDSDLIAVLVGLYALMKRFDIDPEEIIFE